MKAQIIEWALVTSGLFQVFCEYTCIVALLVAVALCLFSRVRHLGGMIFCAYAIVIAIQAWFLALAAALTGLGWGALLFAVFLPMLGLIPAGIIGAFRFDSAIGWQLITLVGAVAMLGSVGFGILYSAFLRRPVG